MRHEAAIMARQINYAAKKERDQCPFVREIRNPSCEYDSMVWYGMVWYGMVWYDGSNTVAKMGVSSLP